MSTLVSSLLVGIALIIIGILIYNWRIGGGLQKLKDVKLNRAASRSGVSDNQTVANPDPTATTALSPVGEPTIPELEAPAAASQFIDSASPQSAAASTTTAPVEHSLTHKLEPSEQTEVVSQSAPARYVSQPMNLDESVDCVVVMRFNAPVAAEKLIQQTRAIRRVGGKPVGYDGQSEDGVWEAFVAGERYSSARTGVLLANRHGPLNAMEFSEFVGYVQSLAEQLDAHLSEPVQIPEMTVELKRARELDERCARLDAQLCVNVLSPEALSTADLGRLCNALALVERGNNRYAKLSEHGEVLYSVSLADAPNRLSFLIDVPRVPATNPIWDHLTQTATAMAEAVQGKIVDDVDKPLGKEALQQIGRSLYARQSELYEAGFAAGSPTAMRLFN
jgi:ZipA, C-terminal FtsZ-binding domain